MLPKFASQILIAESDKDHKAVQSAVQEKKSLSDN